MISVKITGHEYRYEVYQIVSLFYDKSEILFSSEEEKYDVESILGDGFVECSIYRKGQDAISSKINIDPWDKKNVKNAIKKTLLRCLELYTGFNVPWGILVGIRPTKLVHDGFKNGLDEKEIFNHLVEYYEVSKEKAELAIEVAKREAPLLVKEKNSISMYIDIPFCPTRCVYCSFTSNPLAGNSKLVEDYLENLIEEIDKTLSNALKRGISIDTLYIGGGTPTALTASQMGRLLDIVNRHIYLENLREFTVEAGRPDSIDYDKLEVLRKFNCGRISINPQTMNDETLKKIGRSHTVQDVIEKYNMARELGFDNINMDIIIGLPGENEVHIQKTMKELKKLLPDSITVHTMAIKRASILNEEQYRVKNSTAGIMYNTAISELRNMGMYPYYMYRQKNMVSPLENVGYCREGKEGIYNVQMIAENISILAFGSDAVSKIVFDKENRIERSANIKDVREYNKRIDEMVKRKSLVIDMICESMM